VADLTAEFFGVPGAALASPMTLARGAVA